MLPPIPNQTFAEYRPYFQLTENEMPSNTFIGSEGLNSFSNTYACISLENPKPLLKKELKKELTISQLDFMIKKIFYKV